MHGDGGNILEIGQVQSTTERIEVDSDMDGITVVLGGPQGPPGIRGLQGLAGPDGTVVAEAMIVAHIESPAPHPAYDEDMPNLTIQLENGLI